MASSKKQDKPSTVPEQAVPAPAEQGLISPPSGSNATAVDAVEPSTAIAGPAADPGASDTQETGSPVTELPTELTPVATPAEDAAGAGAGAGAGASLSQPGQTGDALHSATDAAELGESTLSVTVELNPATVEVYPLRSFMDEGELRRRGGPSYQVPKLHAEELEQRQLISRTPLEE